MGSNQIANKLEHLPRDTGMFYLPNIICFLVQNCMLEPELWPFQNPHDLPCTAYIPLRMKKIRLHSSSPVSNCKQSQPLLKSVPSANENQVPKPIHYKKKDKQARFICVSRHNFDLPRERSPQITKMKYNLIRGNTYHF